MNNNKSLLKNIRRIALSVALTVTLSIGLYSAAPRPSAARPDLATVAGSQILLADSGQETHGQETHGSGGGKKG